MSEKTYREKVQAAATSKTDKKLDKDVKDGKLNWSGYLNMSDDPKVKYPTEQAKAILDEAFPQFLSCIKERIEGEREWWTEHGATYPPAGTTEQQWLFLMTGWYFFKWLGQIPAFDPANDPGRPVPLMMCWANNDGKLGFTHNFIGKHFDNMINVATLLHPMMEYIKEFFDKEEKKVNKWQRKQAKKN